MALRSRLVAFGVIASIAGCKKPAPLFERIYGLEEIPTFSITLDEAATASLAERPREWVGGAFSYGDTKLSRVAVRLKGHRSLRKLDDKPSFKLKLDRFDKKQKLAGQTELTLNNMVEDPTVMREVLAYRLYRALGVAAPSAGFAEVIVNGESKGLYAVIESIDGKFLKKRFSDGKGQVYEGEWGCDVVPDDVGGFDQDGGPKDRTPLAEFAKIAAGDAKTLFGDGSPLDVPAFLRFLAVDMYVANFDGYRHGHNYRLYFEPKKRRWYFIPWGLDRTFVKDMSIFDSQGYLATRCFADDDCRARYVRVMRDVVAEARRLRLEDGVTVIDAVTAPVIERDPKRRGDIERKRAELRTFLDQRPAEVEAELSCVDASGNALDADHDGYACRDCNDRDPQIHPGAAETCDRVDTDCDGIADNAACACETVTVGAARFAVCPFELTYADADALCVAAGGKLARVDSVDEDRALRAAARPNNSKPDRYWLGLDDRAGEGKFRWLDGDTTYSHWDRGEPDNAGCNQDCTILDTEDGRWLDTHCLEHHRFICRLPAEPAAPR